MRLHARIVAWVFIVFGVAGLALAAGLFLLWAGLGTAALVEDGSLGGGAVGWSVGIAMGGFVAAISIPNIIAGYGLLRRRPWGKPLGIGLGVLNLIFAPIGTIFGIYAIIALLGDDSKPAAA